MLPDVDTKPVAVLTALVQTHVAVARGSSHAPLTKMVAVLSDVATAIGARESRDMSGVHSHFTPGRPKASVHMTVPLHVGKQCKEELLAAVRATEARVRCHWRMCSRVGRAALRMQQCDRNVIT